MSNQNDMVFPVVLAHTRTPNDTAQLGLTKRELFAALAMQGMLASESEASNYGHIGFLAESAVKRADALLAELAKS